MLGIPLFPRCFLLFQCEKMSVMAQRDSAAAAEAVRVIGLLLARPDEPDRIERVQRATACARASAEATSMVAATLGTEAAAIEAETANSLEPMRSNCWLFF